MRAFFFLLMLCLSMDASCEDRGGRHDAETDSPPAKLFKDPTIVSFGNLPVAPVSDTLRAADAPADMDTFIKMEMKLSALGVESNDFPNLDAYLDLVNDTGNCRRWYDDPAHPVSGYVLTRDEIRSIVKLLRNSDLSKLKKEYTVQKTDQPASTVIIQTTKHKYEIIDYGMEGDAPLPELYKIVYKL